MHATPPTVFGRHDAKTLEQIAQVAAQADATALMADGHVGYFMPVGGVAAYRDRVSVTGVGYDIACGNAAIKTDLAADAFDRRELERLANEIQKTVSFGIGRSNLARDAPTDHPLFADAAWDALPRSAQPDRLRAKARDQLGTVGGGNHYVDVFAGSDGAIWVGVHFGSRGLGHTVASGFLALAAGREWTARVPEFPALLDLSSGTGQGYWELMSLAGRYAYAGREWVARKVVEILGAREIDLVHNHHNFAWRERHPLAGGREVVVVRKGATPAWPGQRGFVGGSMGDDAVILRGRPNGAAAVRALQERSLYSTVHGAGRVMSRSEAAGKRNRRTGEILRPGKVTHEAMRAWLSQRGVVLRGGGLDEAPQAYRRLPEVLAAQGDTIEVLVTLRPLIVVMAGPEELDPYRD